MRVLKRLWTLLILALLAACAVVENPAAGELAAAGAYVATFRQDGTYFRSGDSSSVLEWRYFPDSSSV